MLILKLVLVLLLILALVVPAFTLPLRSEGYYLPLNYVADWPQTQTQTQTQTQKQAGYKETAGIANRVLRHKANEYDNWSGQHHHPFYGGAIGVLFKNAQYTQVAHYYSYGDSCLWTGVYLGSQAMRYHVTKDPEAHANLIRAAKALDGYLHITNTTGYIARYWGPQNPLVYPGDEACKREPACHKVTIGKYAGDFWQGSTSKDQYTGWFYGMALAYEFVDDADIKRMIRDDVVEVVDKLIKSGWIILDEKGEYHYFSSAHRPTYIYQLSWLVIVYHMTGNTKYKSELQGRLDWYHLWWEDLTSFTAIWNRYNQFYGNNLGHTTWYNLLRLGKMYFSHDTHERLKDIFTNDIHALNKLEHNAWFNAIFMSQGNYQPEPHDDKHHAQLIEDLTDFRPVPNHAYFLPARNASTYQLDPFTSWVKYFPQLLSLLSQIKFNLKPQALHAFPVQLQCYCDFIFQCSPYVIEACGFDHPLFFQPGIDYIAPYWLAVYEKLITLDD